MQTMVGKLITKNRKGNLYLLAGFFSFCVICVSVFSYVYIFTSEEIPLFPIIVILIISICSGLILFKSGSITEVDLSSGDVFVRFPVGLTKVRYSKNEIIGFNIASQMYLPKLPFNHSYICVELYFYTTDNKIHGTNSLITINFEEILGYFNDTYPMVNDKKNFKPYTEEKKQEVYKSVLNSIEEDKRGFWKQKKKDLLIFLIVIIAVGLFYFILYNYL